MFKRIALIVLLAIPGAAWAFVEPIRVLAPEFAGVTCPGSVCVDDLSRLSEAVSLYEEAVRYVDENVGTLHTAPRAVFCSTLACSKSFGFTSAWFKEVGSARLWAEAELL